MRPREALVEGSLRSLRLERQVEYAWNVGAAVTVVVLLTWLVFP